MFTFKNGREAFRQKQDGETLSVLITGDCFPGFGLEKTILEGGSKKLLAGIQDSLDDCDLSVVQFETPLTDDDTPIWKSGPNLKVAPGCVDFIKEAGFDVALLANNHTGDFGTKAVIDTIEILENNGFKTVGAGKNLEDAVKPLFVEQNGLKVAFLNYAENEFGTALTDAPGASPLNPVKNITQIREVSEQADITIVIVHGGNEFNPVPSPRMVDTYRAFADAGASAVVNIHAHCLQGIELWNGVPIVYCPGNFFFPYECMNNVYRWWFGYLVKFNFDRQGAFGLEVVPYRFDYDGVYRLEGEPRENFLRYLAEISAIIKDPEKVTAYFDAWCSLRSAVLDSFKVVDKDYPAQRDKNRNSLMPLRNMFSCEAHCEIIKRLFRMVAEDLMADAKAFEPELKRLMDVSF